MTPSELYAEINARLMEEERPSDSLIGMQAFPLLHEFPFSMLHRLRDTPQSPAHHPEGNVWNHTLLVVDEAAKAKDKSHAPPVFMWAALLHDIGKPDTTRIRKGKITAYNHDRVGAKLAVEYLRCFTGDAEFVDRVAALIRYHMQILYVVSGLPFADIPGMKRDTDIHEVALLGLCDRLGRAGSDRNKEERNIKTFLRQCGRNK